MGDAQGIGTAKPTRLRGRRPRGRVVVELPVAPPTYTMGSGPPLAPITLTLPRDTTAYIIDRTVMPVLSKPKGKLISKRMAYVVGWTDYPAARKLIGAGQILDYVSPMALEEWEYKNFLELEAEEERQAAHDEEDVERRSGRPRPPRLRKEPEVDESKSQDVAAQEKKRRGRPRKDWPSLSSPQKVRLRQQLEDLYDNATTDIEEEPSPSKAIYNQLYGEDMEVDEVEPAAMERGEGSSSSEVQEIASSPFSLSPVPPISKTRSRTGTPRKASPQPSLPSSQITSQTASSVRQPSKLSTSYVPSPSLSARVTPVPLPSPPSWAVNYQNSLRPPQTPSQKTMPLMDQSSRWSSAVAGTEPHTAKASHAKCANQSLKKKRPASSSLPKKKKDVWEVKQLEDMKTYDVDGYHVRYYQVRWEGDWPPDQNPTWEPEANLPARLAKEFRDKRARMGIKEEILPEPEVEVDPWPNKNCSSFSEMFEDAEADLAGYMGQAAVEEDCNRGEVFMVTDEDLGG